MNRYLKLLTFSLTLSTLSCSKETAAPDVTNVVEGTLIHSGDSDPDLQLGNIGDFYINLKTKFLFGPKAKSSWGIGTSLNGNNGSNGVNGSDGKDGANGNTILNGKGAPLTTLGNIGDFYFDTENLAIYGPKSATSWGKPVFLKSSEEQDRVRVLIKNNAKIHEEFTKFSQNYGSYSVRLSVGDINDYIKNGTVLVQARINNGQWDNNDVFVEDKFENNLFEYSIQLGGGYKYDGTDLSVPIDIYAGAIVDPNTPEILASAKKWMNTLNVQFKITLIKADKVETIARLFTGDNVKLNKY